ncbi:MAG: hypothetical protein AAF850_11165 [Pseudomonadota bacterium]
MVVASPVAAGDTSTKLEIQPTNISSRPSSLQAPETNGRANAQPKVQKIADVISQLAAEEIEKANTSPRAAKRQGRRRRGRRRRPAKTDLSLAVSIENRSYFNDAAFAGQLNHFQPSVILAPDFRWETGDRKHTVAISPFARLDTRDNQRTHFDLREAYYRYVGNEWEALVGLTRVFWGVTEGRHLVDIINTPDGVEDIDGEDKLGQPMAKLSLLKDWGKLDVFLLWGFRPQTFPGENGRLRPPVFVDPDEAQFDFGLRRGRPGAAIRYTHTVGAVDIGLSYFHGPGREPDFTLAASGDRVSPIYKVINQGGVDIQYTGDSLLLKAEAIVREGQGQTFAAAVAGFEYTAYGLIGDADVGFLMEYLYDGRDSFSFTAPGVDIATFETPAPPTAFENDIFIGARLGMNNPQAAGALIGAVIDADDGSSLVSIEASQRLGANWLAEFEARLFINIAAEDQLAIFADDDFATLRLTRYF